MHLVSKDGVYMPYCLSALDIPDIVPPKINEKNKSQLYKFIELQKKDQLYIDDDSSICDFVDSKGINYIIVEDGAIMHDKLLERSYLITTFQGCSIYKVKKQAL